MKSLEKLLLVCSIVLNLVVADAAPAQTEAKKKKSVTTNTQTTSQRTPFSASPFYIESQLEKIDKRVAESESDKRFLDALQQESKFEAEHIVELQQRLQADGGLMQTSETLRSDLHKFAPGYEKQLREMSGEANNEANENNGSLNAVVLFRRYQGLQTALASIDSAAQEIKKSVQLMNDQIDEFIRKLDRRKAPEDKNGSGVPEAGSEDGYTGGPIRYDRRRNADPVPRDPGSMGTGFIDGPPTPGSAKGVETTVPSRYMDPIEMEKLAAGLNPDNNSGAINTLFLVNVELQRKSHELVRDLTSLERDAKKVERKITRYVAETEAELSEVTRIRDGLELDRRAAQLALTRQARLNPLLVTAIVMMIVAMVALYYSLSWFRSEFAERLIKQRVLIELLSMSFLLLTVIILGSLRLLDSTALAALLGTMSGYIFARKAKRKAADEEVDPVAVEDGV